MRAIGQQLAVEAIQAGATESSSRRQPSRVLKPSAGGVTLPASLRKPRPCIGAPRSARERPRASPSFHSRPRVIAPITPRSFSRRAANVSAINHSLSSRAGVAVTSQWAHLRACTRSRAWRRRWVSAVAALSHEPRPARPCDAARGSGSRDDAFALPPARAATSRGEGVDAWTWGDGHQLQRAGARPPRGCAAPIARDARGRMRGRRRSTLAREARRVRIIAGRRKGVRPFSPAAAGTRHGRRGVARSPRCRSKTSTTTSRSGSHGLSEDDVVAELRLRDVDAASREDPALVPADTQNVAP